MHPVKEFYVKTLSKVFPPVRYGFAYGSAVFKQEGREKGAMLDLVFAVDDPLEWHKQNLSRNRRHYSFLRNLGPGRITALQKRPAGIYYNTLVSVDSQLLKYGVISCLDLIRDLRRWEWLYVSGRLHKPVVTLTEFGEDTLSQSLREALSFNLWTAALCGVLLQQKEVFTAEDLFTTICGLSYKGDFRMIIGEDKRKIENIVRPNLQHFHELYSSVLEILVEALPNGIMKRRDNVDLDCHRHQLPVELISLLQQGKGLAESIRLIVKASSVQQSAKGILTAGVTKTLSYAASKLKKMILSHR